MKPYNFAVLRYVHSQFSGESVNVAVLFWLPEDHQLHFEVNERYGRLTKIFSDFDGQLYRRLIRALKSQVEVVARRLAEMQGRFFQDSAAKIDERILQELVPSESPSFQWSEIMGGAVENPAVRLAALFFASSPATRRPEGAFAGTRRQS